MSSFKFNFSKDDNYTDQKEAQDENNIQWLKSEEIRPDKQIKSLDDIVSHAKMFTYDEVEIGHVVPREALANMGQASNDTTNAENQHSDLVIGKYEGGLKIWECTRDLIEYLAKNKEISFENAHVLDLGCGAGLLGIYAFMNGARVTFQDYNKEVIECVTIPNVLLNIEDEEQRENKMNNCKFYSGDWAYFNCLLGENELFDVIFTSETIYNPNNYDKIIDIFSQHLSRGGKIYVAAKTYYFGVGGGTRDFLNTISKNGKFNSVICWQSSGGIQREIIKITRVNDL